MSILNIAGYKFISLSNLEKLQRHLLETAKSLQLKGTILLSTEGINLSLAGTEENINCFKTLLQKNALFANIIFHETYSEEFSFRYLKVKIKKEIITFKQPAVNPVCERAPSIHPETLKQWLDEKKDFALLDTRNDYEIRFGKFKHAEHLQINDFGQFPDAIQELNKEKTIVMYCTGGIRCEKAALLMLAEGFKNVLQLEGGILGYFAKAGGAHYEGECFVFDERIAVNPDLTPSNTLQCKVCEGPVPLAAQRLSSFITKACCPACDSNSS